MQYFPIIKKNVLPLQRKNDGEIAQLVRARDS